MDKYHLYWLKKQGALSRDYSTCVLHLAQGLSTSKTKHELASAAALCRGLCYSLSGPTWSLLIGAEQGQTPVMALHATTQHHLPPHEISPSHPPL